MTEESALNDINDSGPAQFNRSQTLYPTMTRVEDGIAYDKSGKKLGPYDERAQLPPESTATPGFVDYNPQTPSSDAGTPGFVPLQEAQHSADGFQNATTITLPPELQPKAAAPPQAAPPESSIHHLWDLANRGLISKDKILDVMQRASATGQYQDVTTRRFHPTAHIPGFGDIDLDTLQKGVMDSTAGVLSSFTSPLSIALFGSGAAAKATATAADLVNAERAAQAAEAAGATSEAQGIRAAAASQAGTVSEALSKSGASAEALAGTSKALTGAARTAGLGIQATQIPQIIRGQQPGESPADALERRLNAAGWTMLAGAEEGKSLNSKALSRPISELPESVRDDAQRFKTYTRQQLATVTDTLGNAVGRTNNFSKAVTSMANMLGKKAGPEFQEKVDNVSGDLKEILNNDTANKIVDPKSAAAAIREHLNLLEQPMQEKAGVERDSSEAVVPNFRQRLEDRIDKFFDDNRQKYGSAEDVEAIKQRLLNRLTAKQDMGNGLMVDRDPNLYEAENARQGLSKSSGDVFETGTTSGYRAASGDIANFLREVIDESYDSKGVTGVKEARRKEADLIDVADALEDAQGRFEQQNNMPALLKLFSMGKVVGMVGALGAHFLGGNLAGLALGAGTLWKTAHEHYTQNIEANLNRAQQLAAREPNASATTPGTGPVRQGPVGPPPSLPGVPPRPEPPPPAVPPAKNHKIASGLSTYYGEFLGESPYEDLLQRFTTDVADMKRSIAKQDGKYTQPQLDKAMRLQEKINTEHAAENAQVEKQNQTNQAKYVKELQKWQTQYEAAKAKIEEAKIANSTAQETARQDKIKALLTDERIAHSPILKALDPVHIIVGAGDHTSEQAHNHEHGHIMANVAEGLDPIHFISEHHPDAEATNAVAAIQTDVSDAMGQGAKGIARRVVGILGGPAFDAVHHDMPLGRNTAARGDVARARQILRDEGGLSGADVDKVFDALYDRAKEHVSNPEALALVEANAPLRESGLHDNFHMSAGRMAEYVKKLKGAYGNGKTPTTAGVREGAADGGVPEGESDKSGGEGKQQNGPVKGIPSGEARKNLEAAASKREQSGLTAAPEKDIVEGQGLKYKGELVPGSNVHMFEHPEHPGKTAALQGPLTPDTVREKMASKLKEFGIQTAPEKQPFVGTHYSNVPAEGGVLSGATRGKANAGSEAARVALGAEPGVYAYREGTRPEPQIRSRANKYTIQGNKAIADISGPQKSLFENAYNQAKADAIKAGDSDTVAGHKGLNAAETALKNAGFDGYEHKEDYPGNTFLFGNQNVEQSNLNKHVVDSADEYNKENGRPEIDGSVKPHDAEFGKRVADAFDKMKHEPDNPAVQKSYKAMANEVRKQWDYATQKMGIKFEPWNKEGQPYANSKEMMKDVEDNKHLYFFQGGDLKSESPMAQVDPETGLSYNDMFRAVHDLFGHSAHGFEFGPKGEENAYLVHRQMFPAEAIPALTSETRGQNSWVNFGKHLRNAEGNVPKKGEEGYIPQTERPYAEQKVGLLPDEFNQSNVEQSDLSKVKGSSIPLMEEPLKVKGTMQGGEVGTLDLAKALNQYSLKKNSALAPGSEPEEMVARAKEIAEDEAKYQLAQSKTGTEWYTTEMKDHDKVLQSLRPELAEGETTEGTNGHPVNLTLFKAAEAILSSGQKPYANIKSAIRAWDHYKETGEFSPINPTTGKSWGPRNVAAYGNAFEAINKLISEKGEKGAADWLLGEHPVSELKKYNDTVSGKKDDLATGAMILGEKRGPFMQNLHGIESKFTADMWVSRTWNRWMGTLDLDPRINEGKVNFESDSPRNNTERTLMKQSFQETADKLGLTTSSLQAVLWYYEQGLYRAHGLPVQSWSFSDAAKRVANEMKAVPEEEQTAFPFGENPKAAGVTASLSNLPVAKSKFANISGKARP